MIGLNGNFSTAISLIYLSDKLATYEDGHCESEQLDKQEDHSLISLSGSDIRYLLKSFKALDFLN